MKNTTWRRFGVALAMPVLAAWLASCGGADDFNAQIADISVEPGAIPAPTADQPSTFKLKIRTTKGDDLRLFVDAYETGSEHERQRIAYGDPHDNQIEIECSSMLVANAPDKREVDCFGTEYPSVIRSAGPLRLRLALYQHVVFDGTPEFSDDIKTFTFELK